MENVLHNMAKFTMSTKEMKFFFFFISSSYNYFVHLESKASHTHSVRVRSFWSRSLRSGTLRSRSFGSEAKFGHFGRGHYGPGHFGRGHFCLYFRHKFNVDI